MHVLSLRRPFLLGFVLTVVLVIGLMAVHPVPASADPAGVPSKPTRLSTRYATNIETSVTRSCDGYGFGGPPWDAENITNYQYQVGSGPWLDATWFTSCFFKFPALELYVDSQVRIRAVNSIGPGPASDPFTIRARFKSPNNWGRDPYPTSIDVWYNPNDYEFSGATINRFRCRAFLPGTRTVVATGWLPYRPATYYNSDPYPDPKCTIPGLTPCTSYDVENVVAVLRLDTSPNRGRVSAISRAEGQVFNMTTGGCAP